MCRIVVNAINIPTPSMINETNRVAAALAPLFSVLFKTLEEIASDACSAFPGWNANVAMLSHPDVAGVMMGYAKKVTVVAADSPPLKSHAKSPPSILKLSTNTSIQISLELYANAGIA